MSVFASCIYSGTVVHKRLEPRRHAFSYRVFSLCLDVDELDRLDRDLRTFSRNRWNLLAIRDSDLGGPGTATLAQKVRAVLDDAGLTSFSSRIELLCYPRVLGYVFNPLSVYFCRDSDGCLGAVIYEVTNTFGERKSYVIEADQSGQSVISQDCAKDLYVSPFTAAEGQYSFHVVPPCDRVLVGIAFREKSRAVLKTHFRGDRLPLTDANLVRMLASHPLMTLKVIGAIHLQTARLWGKGVPLVTRHTSPAYSFTIVKSQSREVQHA